MKQKSPMSATVDEQPIIIILVIPLMLHMAWLLVFHVNFIVTYSNDNGELRFILLISFYLCCAQCHLHSRLLIAWWYLFSLAYSEEVSALKIKIKLGPTKCHTIVNTNGTTALRTEMWNCDQCHPAAVIGVVSRGMIEISLIETSF